MVDMSQEDSVVAKLVASVRTECLKSNDLLHKLVFAYSEMKTTVK